LASDYERNALAEYYNVVSLKESRYSEYKHKKQKFLLDLDYNTLKENGKVVAQEKYKDFYVDKQDTLYRGLLKIYCIDLTDNISKYKNKDEIFDTIMNTVEEYVDTIFEIKLRENEEKYKEIIDVYEKYKSFEIGKPTENDILERRVCLLAISRFIFTHSIPLAVAEKCYINLIRRVRELIITSLTMEKREMEFDLLMKITEEYTQKLLATKVYWDDLKQKEKYTNFMNKYNKLETLKELDANEYRVKRKVLLLKYDMQYIKKEDLNYKIIIKTYKQELAMLEKLRSIKGFKFKRTRRKRTVSYKCKTRLTALKTA
jgi:hypothetical protein